jgi:hypothetical protein
MQGNVGASIPLWPKIFPGGDIWFAEYGNCVDTPIIQQALQCCGLVKGDQSNPEDLERWIKESGGAFNVIVDDGGHKNSQILTSLQHLWPALLPGGVYVLEDLHVGRSGSYDDSPGSIMVDIVGAWTDYLVIGKRNRRRQTGHEYFIEDTLAHHPPPYNLKFVYCQNSACVLGKCEEVDKGKYGSLCR